MQVVSFKAATPAEFRARLNDHPAATLALLFSSIEHDVAQLQTIATAHNVRVCGCSTAGEVIDGELTSGTITGLLFTVDPNAFVTWSGIAGSIAAQAEQLGREAVERYADPHVFLLSGGMTVDGEDIIAGVRGGAGRAIKVFGGLAADDFKLEATFSFSESETVNPGLIAVIFDGSRVALDCHTTSGWEPLGIENTITSAEGNVVHTINDEPALDFFTRFFGELTNSGVEVAAASVVNSQYPLQIQRPEGAVLRAPLMPGEDGSIVLAGGVRSGDRFRFSIAPGFEVIDQTVAYFNERQAARPAPDAVVMVSCKGRHAAFGPMLEDEVEQIHELYAAPMAGYLSYGEIGSVDGSESALHNDTCCMITFRAVAS